MNHQEFESTLRELARAVMTDISSESAPSRVETALRAAYRAHVTSHVNNGVAQHWKSIKSSLWPQWRLVATAATIIILISVIAALWAQSKSDIEKPITQASIDASDKPYQQEISAAPFASAPDKVRVRRRPARRKPSVPEVVTEFYPLMEGADLDSLEVVQMVRVELPASALRVAGLPVGQELMNEPVKADVMLGYDGLARAIRFVR